VHLVAQDPQQVAHARAVVLAVLAEVVEERAVERLLPVVTDDLVRAPLEREERWLRRVARHDLEPVRRVADEEEALLSVPEKGVQEDEVGGRAVEERGREEAESQ